MAEGNPEQPGSHASSRPSASRNTRSAALAGLRGMAHQDDGFAPLAVQVREERQYLGRGDGIQVPGGLVGQNDGRLVDQGPGNRGPLHLSARNLVRFVALAAAQTHLPQPVRRLLSSLVVGSSLEDPGQGDVFFQGQEGQQVEGLEYHPHPIPPESGPLGLPELRQVAAVQEYPAAAHRLQAADDMQQGALATTALAGDGDEFP